MRERVLYPCTSYAGLPASGAAYALLRRTTAAPARAASATTATAATPVSEVDGVEEAAEEEAARRFGAARTFFSGGGCTLCIQTMLMLASGGGRILMARNAHRSALHTAALLGLDPVWCWPDYTRSTGPIGADAVEKMLNTDHNIRSVYITSPD